jgi:hypothetical protein
MTFKTTCPNCSQRFEATDEHIGVAIICPNCQEEFIVEKIPELLLESHISITEATTISDRFIDLMADKKTTYAPASLLPASKVRIVKAMMIWMAQLKKDGHFNHVKSFASTAASGLTFFIDDEDCVLVNDDSCLEEGYPEHSRNRNIPRKWGSDFKELRWMKEVEAFIDELEKFSTDDPLYWQKVYTLAGVSMTPLESKKKGFWSGLLGG